MRIQREEKGITLIALIITMIVLLILAGVSIAMLTGENGILKRAEGTEITQAQAELTEEIQLAIMESLIDRDNAHTIDNVLQIAEANSYISINNQHTLMNIEPETSEIGISAYSLNTNVYVTDDCTTATVVDVDLGVWVTLGQVGTDITITSGNGNDTINVADLRILKLEFEVGDPYTEDGKENLVDIKVKAILDPNSSKKSSYIKEIRDENGNELTLQDLEGGQNGDQNSYAIYTVESNGEYRFTALEEHGGKATRTATVSNSNYAEIEFEKNPDGVDGKKAAEVVVTINYDEFINEETFEYSINDGEWKSATNGQEVIVVENGTTVYARYNYGGEIFGNTECLIDYIDNQLPTEPGIMITDTSCSSVKIDIIEAATDEGGIEKYEIILMKNDQIIKKQEIRDIEIESVAFVDLEIGQMYEVVVKVYDESGNVFEMEPEEVGAYHIIKDEDVNILFTVDTDLYCECGEYILTVPKGYKIPENSTEDFLSKRNALLEGVVIQDSSLNEFVWIEAEATNEAVEKLLDVNIDSGGIYTSSVTADTVTEPKVLFLESYSQPGVYYSNDAAYGVTLAKLQSELKLIQDMVKSREEGGKGGFYIGRYEQSVVSSKPQSKKNQAVQRSVTWYTLYETSKKYTNSSNSSISGAMVTNSQWDIMMEWLPEDKIQRTTGGNEEYISGQSSSDVIQNIYDMIGGVTEWNTGGYSTYGRMMRGGYVTSTNTSASSAIRSGAGSLYTVDYAGTRLSLIW